MNNFRNQLQSLFKLSPLEKRRENMGRVGDLFSKGAPIQHYRDNYNYIAVLAFRNTLIISAAVGIAVIISVLYLTHVLQINPLSLEYLGYDYLATKIGFVGLYAYVHAKIMEYVILISAVVYFLLFLIHVKKGEEDIFRYEKVFKYKKNRILKEKSKRIFLFIFGIFMGWLMSGHSYITLSFVSRWGPESGLGDSYILLLIYYGFSIVCHAYAALLLYIGMIMSYGLMAGYDKYGGV